MASKPYFGLQGNRLNWLIIAISGLEFLLFGYDQGVMGGLLTLPSFTSTFPSICPTTACTVGLSESEKSYRSTIQGVAISSYSLGCFCSALLVLRYGDTFGRRKAVFVGCTLVSIGAILQAAAFHLPHFIVGRVVCGMGAGINTATVPVWQAECIKPHLRGPVMAFETSLVIAGVMISYWIDFGFSYIDPNQAAWRFPIAFQLVFSLTIMAVIMGLPESPRWLMLRGKQEDATKVICALYGLAPGDTLVNEEILAIAGSLHLSEVGGFSKMFSSGPLKNSTRAGISLAIQVMGQLSGTNVITYYAAFIYESEIGLSPFLSRVLAACNGTQFFIASMFSIPLIKHFNRRTLLVTSASGMCLSMTMLAVLTSIGGREAGIGASVFLFVFNTSFGIAWAQISWMLPAEVTPLPIRSPVNAASTASHWICNFMVVMVTPVAFTNIGWRTYILFAVFNFASLPIVYFFFPETSGRSLEEIDLIFSESANIFEAVSKSKTMERHFDNKGNLMRSLVQDVENSKVLQETPGKRISLEYVE